MSKPQAQPDIPRRKPGSRAVRPLKTAFAIILALLFVLSCFSFAVHAEYFQKQLRHYLIQARIRYDNERYKEAIELWDKALELDPDNNEALRYSERARDKLDRINKKKAARKRLREAAQKDSPLPKQVPLTTQPPEQKQATAQPPERRQPAPQPPQRTQPRDAVALKDPEFSIEIPERTFHKPQKELLSFDDALALGLQNHLPIQIAREQIELSSLKEKEAFRELFPEASLKWDETSGVVSNRDFVGRKYQLKLKHPLYHGGELRYTWKQAQVNLKVAYEHYEKTTTDYALELAKAYYDFVKAIKNVAVQEGLLKDLEKDLSMAKQEHEQEVATLVDFLNVQSQYNQTYYTSLSADNNLSLARASFLQLLNLDNDPTLTVQVDTELTLKEHSVDLDECIALAYENRSSLKIKEMEFKSAEYGEKIKKSEQLPWIDLTGNVGKSGEVFTPGTLEMSDVWYVGAKVNVPWGPNTMKYSYTKEDIAPSLTVFTPTQNEIHSFDFKLLDNLANYTETKESKVKYEEAYSDLLKAKQEIATEVRDAYFNYEESLLKVMNSLANKELYEKELAIVNERRLMNEAKTQDVVAAKVKVATEFTNYNAALVENVVALKKLNKAIGIEDYYK